MGNGCPFGSDIRKSIINIQTCGSHEPARYAISLPGVSIYLDVFRRGGY
jgi:hypothetical protein